LFSHTGDGVVAAFSSPKAAVDTAVAAQRALELPVRMGAATGEAEHRSVPSIKIAPENGYVMQRERLPLSRIITQHRKTPDRSRSGCRQPPDGVELHDIRESDSKIPVTDGTAI
jgi:hypothetical protein